MPAAPPLVCVVDHAAPPALAACCTPALTPHPPPPPGAPADDPNKFYAFASNTAGNDLDVRIVSSQLLYNNALGEEIIKSLQLNQDDNLLTQAIENGLNDLNFPEMIKSSLTTGKVNTDTKSFKIGKIRVRFILNISTD